MGKRGALEAAAVRRQHALDLRIAGVRYREIGAQLGVSHQTAFRDVTAALAEIARDTTAKAERLRQIQCERCEQMTRALWPKALSGDERAIRAQVQVMERHAKLLGLDLKPTIGTGGEDYAQNITIVHSYME